MNILAALDVPSARIAEFSQKWQLSEFAIFGSAARGELRSDSDIDVMVSFAPSAEPRLGDLVDMGDELQVIFGRHVDVIPRGSIRNPFRRRSIMRDLMVVYAA